MRGDTALIKLHKDDSLEFFNDASIKAASLPKNFYHLNALRGNKCEVSGWGDTEAGASGAGNYIRALRAAEVKIVKFK